MGFEVAGRAVQAFGDSVTVAGDEARHGVESTEPPAEAMSLGEARSFIDGLLRRWLENGAV
jgi:hypothetical protein